ncbi:MAG: tetratricopeptide repeat protein [Sedimentisphaerales bacterium]|jgi:tetratricopeptide (TPR) repeat protein
MPEQVKKSLVLSIYFALLISTLLVFWQVRNFDFVKYDDSIYIYENPHVLNGLTAGSISWAFTTGFARFWHPLTWLSLMLDCQLSLPGGPSPGWMHMENVLLHIINTLLLFIVLKKMTGALWQSVFVAALFALHPLHVESVAWIAERKDVLSTLFWLLAMLAYWQYVKKPNAARYLLVLLIFALGLMAKPMLVTLPFVFLLLDYWPLERIKHFQWPALYRLVLEKIPFIVLSIASSIIAFIVQQSGRSFVSFVAIPSLKFRIANVFLSYAQYMDKMFWPCNLAVFYPFDAAGILFWQAASCALLLLGITFFVVRFGRSHRYLPVGWFWFLGTLMPVIGLVRYTMSAYADRYTYVSYIGLFVMIAWSLPQLLSNLPQRKIVLGLSMVIVLTALGICAHRQTSYWKNSFTLFSHALAVTQNNYIAYNNIGLTYNDLGRYAEALDDFRQAIKIKPDYEIAYYNLGNAYSNLGRWPQAMDAYKQAIRIDPNYAQAHSNLGVAYGSLGRYDEAIDAFEQAIKIEPDLADAYCNLGATYSRLNRRADEIEAYRQAVKIRPDLADAHYNLGLAYLAIGDKNSALTELNILKSLNPQLADKLLKDINK